MTRTNRRRRRAAGALIATAAATTLALGGTHSAAEAAVIPSIPAISAGCDAGDPDVVDSTARLPIVGTPIGPEIIADCSESEPSIIAQLGDQVLGQLLPGFSLSALNTAGAVTGGVIDSTATIKGNGFTTALVPLLGGHASASAENYISGALAISTAGGNTQSSANLGGLGIALAVGPGTAVADAQALSIVYSSVAGGLDGDRVAAASAFGGIASAMWNPIDGGKAICTAAFATASVSDGGGNDTSCTSILFIFQQSQDGDGPVVYAIKNPFSVNLVSPISESISGSLGDLLALLGLPDGAADLLSGGIIPEFNQDLIRISFGPNGPVIGSDVIPGLSTTSTTSTLARTAAVQDEAPATFAATLTDVNEDAPADTPTAADTSGDVTSDDADDSVVDNTETEGTDTGSTDDSTVADGSDDADAADSTDAGDADSTDAADSDAADSDATDSDATDIGTTDTEPTGTE